MSVAWTTILIILLLLPGIFFFVGMATYERLSREVIRSSVISEVALAIMVALVLHMLALTILSVVSGFQLGQFLTPFVTDQASPMAIAKDVADRALPLAIYTIITASSGFVLGANIAYGVMSGWLRFLAMHKWIYDVIDADRRGGIVTAYVMTTIVEKEKALMYRGRVHEIFLGGDGKIAYVILKNCARFFMSFSGDEPTTTKQLNLFGDRQGQRSTWDYLQIEGDKIANILFDPSPETITATSEGQNALAAELARRQAVVRAMIEERNRPRRPGSSPTTK